MADLDYADSTSGIWSLHDVYKAKTYQYNPTGLVGYATAANTTTISSQDIDISALNVDAYMSVIVVSGCWTGTSFSSSTDNYISFIHSSDPAALSPSLFTGDFISYDTSINLTSTGSQATSIASIAVVFNNYTAANTTFNHTAGTSTNATHGSVSATAGDIAIVFLLNFITTDPTPPDGYTYIGKVQAGSSSPTVIWAAYKEITTTGTESPGNWISLSGSWYTYTVLVTPEASKPTIPRIGYGTNDIQSGMWSLESVFEARKRDPIT